MSKYFYNYNPATKEYTYKEEAYINPVATAREGKNIYSLPANATFEKPPTTKTHEIAVFENNGWQIKADYRGMYKINSDMKPELIEQIGSLNDGFIAITEAQAQKIFEDNLFYIIENNKLIVNPHYEEDKAKEQEAVFNASFFNTSLGYVRRKVTMKDGTRKDFLTDILPLLQVGVPILTYTKELEQNKVIVTDEFINECKQQVLIDFYGVQ